MKNNKPISGKQSVTTVTSRNTHLPTASTIRGSKTAVDKFAVPTAFQKKVTTSSRPPTASSSQESLSGIGTSVRRKTPKPVPRPNPIRLIDNLQPVKKITAKSRLVQGNMRRAVSKDSVDFAAKEREKENVKVPRSSSKNSCVTILQMEKEKVQMEKQISELVKNAESKKAEIATLKMEINKLKDLKSDDAVDQLRQELESMQLENQALKEHLVQLGVPLEMTALSDNTKEQILIQRSLSGSFLNLDKAQTSSEGGGPKSLDGEGGGASGVHLPPSSRSLSEWERGSSSSLSESVACLQDRIVQMEETHHSTNEELQATLQELTDLQDQLSDLQLDNERMADEKAVLLESLCSQTERLEECRTQVLQLKQLLFSSQDGAPAAAPERERNLVDLLKKAQEAHEVLQLQQEELQQKLQAARHECNPQTLLLRDRVRLLESTVESVRADKRLVEQQLGEAREQLSARQIDIDQLKLQLENEQQKVCEFQREREAGDGISELQELLRETRRDKDSSEERSLRLQEQLALAQREAARLKEQLQQAQQEGVVAKNNARSQLSDLEFRLAREREEQGALRSRVLALDEAAGALTLKCQHHLEDKRELRAQLGEAHKALQEKDRQLLVGKKEVEEIKKKHALEVEEWHQFQDDLLTAVRVANDFKTETLQEVEKIAQQNKELLEKNAGLAAEVAALKARLQVVPQPKSELSSAEKELQSKRNQSSVRSLIESIENATKQVKGQGPSSSCSSSSSSLNSITSDPRITANSILNNNDIFIKPSLRSADSKEAKSGDSTAAGPVAHTKADLESQPKPHPVAILSTKLDPMRRNSYGDLAEKKDPLCSLVKGGGSKRNALLKWCQNKTIGYKGIDITNFSSSWNDGLAFCALLHSYLPHLIPYEELDGRDKKRNFTLAFQAAESVGIKTTLNTNDLTRQERPDWQCIMGYVTSIYKHFET